MQVLTTFLFTMATLLLLATAAKATHNGDDGSSPEHLRVLQAQKNKEFKRICGLSFYCQRFTVKRIVTHLFSDSSIFILTPTSLILLRNLFIFLCLNVL